MTIDCALTVLWDTQPDVTFTSKTRSHETFSVHTLPEENKSATITSHFGSVELEKNFGQLNDAMIVFEKLLFKVFSIETKLRFQISTTQCGPGVWTLRNIYV